MIASSSRPSPPSRTTMILALMGASELLEQLVPANQEIELLRREWVARLDNIVDQEITYRLLFGNELQRPPCS